MSDRLINQTAEAALLGALLLDNKLILEVADRVKHSDFGDALHGRIFNAMMKFQAKGMRADAMTLRPLFLHDQDALEGQYLDELVDSPAVVAGAPAIADQVADLAGRRHARQVMIDSLKALEDDLDRPVDEICAQVEAAGYEAASHTIDDGSSDGGDMIGFVEARDDRINSDPGAAGMSNALIDEIDQGLGYLETKTYNIIAGRPGMGKSALAGSAALGYALSGHAGLCINLEMSKEQSGIRLAADAGFALGVKLTASQLRKGGLSRQDRADLTIIREKVKLLPLKFRSLQPDTDIRRIWSIVAREKALFAARGHKLAFVVLDYLGLCSATDAEGRVIDDTRKKMNTVSKMVKRMASELDVCVIALAQLSRGVEARQDKRPMMSDLKESGDLEQDADSITMVYREEYYLQQSEPKAGDKDRESWEAEYQASRDKVDLLFVKNRHGRSTAKQAKFLGDFVAVRSRDVDQFSDTPHFAF